MMWNRLKITATVLALGVTTSLVSYEIASAVRSRDYTASEMRSLLRGFGYNVTPGNTLTDEATKKAIREFQQGYKLTPADGIGGTKTQDFAADLVKNLQGCLNLVVKPSPALPRNQFYGPRTEAAVRQFQRQFNLPITGIANLAVRQRIDLEARRILGKEPQEAPSAAPSSTPSSPAPEPVLSPTPSTTPSPTPSPTTSPSP